MDKIDFHLMKELDTNPKITLSRLSKKLRISQQTADYRVKRLIKSKEITKFGTIINLKSLGYEHYRIFITFKKRNYSNQEIFSYLKNQKGVYWASRVGGQYDLHLVLFVHDFEELDNFIDKLNNHFPDLIKSYKNEYVLKHFIYNHKYLLNKENKIEYGYNDKLQKIDKLDSFILKKIKDNCRLSSLELSKDKNISYKTIINRIKSLEKKKIILGYRLFIQSLNYKPYIVLFSFKDYSTIQEKRLLSYLETNHKVTQALRLFGNWDLYLHLRATNQEELQEFLINLRDKYTLIDNFQIIPIFEDISIDLFPVD
jgi:Lrp/AsnC family leucine-responsive transcriptional regulator